MIEQITQFNEQIATFKDIFAKYVAEKSIPLNERWDAFVTANDALKNNEGFIVRFKSLPEDFIMYGGPIDMERHQTLSTEGLVERIEESKDPEASECEFSAINLDTLKEEILALNLGSFTYDW